MSEFRDQNSEHVGAFRAAKELQSELLGEGREGEVHLRRFETPGGEKRFAHKEVSSLPEAQRGHAIYTKLKEAGLPVASFYKIHSYTDEYDQKKTAIIMQDLSEDGKYSVEPANQGIGGMAYEEVAESKDPQKLRKDMVKAIAIMHNNGVYDFHPGISLFVRVEKDDPQNVDFLFLDYSNMEDPQHPAKPRDLETFDFESECNADRATLLVGIGAWGDEADALTEYYFQLRRDKVTSYSA